jgi:hypothetical protein
VPEWGDQVRLEYNMPSQPYSQSYSQPYNCERHCPCAEIQEPAQLVVLTGGPGAGKTAVLEFVRKVFCEHVAILPEAAGILFGGGFWRLDSPSAKKAAQRAIYHVQEEMQNLVLGEKRWAFGLCDRGTIDGLAYWPNSEAHYFATLDTNLEKEYSKYKAVIQLRSPSLKNGYNYQNPIRIETADMAAKIDQRIHEAWKNHPNYFVIDSTSDFTEKIKIATERLQSLIPDCCGKHLSGVAK